MEQNSANASFFMSITPQSLIDLTYNFYGVKADIASAVEYLNHNTSATPGSFCDWFQKQF